MASRGTTLAAVATLSLGALGLVAPHGAAATTGDRAHQAPPKPHTGAWKLDKAASDGEEHHATMTVTKGDKTIKKLAFTPIGSCVGARIAMVGSQKIKKNHHEYYVGHSSSSSVTVNVTQAGVTSQAGLIVDFTATRQASVVLNAIGTTGGCEYNYQLHKPSN